MLCRRLWTWLNALARPDLHIMTMGGACVPKLGACRLSGPALLAYSVIHSWSSPPRGVAHCAADHSSLRP